MMKRKDWTAVAVTMLFLGAAPMAASAQVAQDPHHPEAQTPAQAPQTPAPGMGGQGGMMGMMGNMSTMNMMGMMRMMGGAAGMMAVSSSGMGMIDHIEGRIAFLHTELKITETQTLEWNTFAEALRTNAQKLGETRTSMMTHMAGEQSATLSQRLEMQEQWLTARLAGTRSLRTSFETLYRVLTDEQKQTANELLAPHMGLMAMGQMGQMGQSPQ